MFKRKKIVFLSLFITALMIFTITLPAASEYEINYEKPIPLDAEVDLIEGLSEEEAAKATELYYNDKSEETQIERIYYNFLKSIDESKYFAGSSWECPPYVLDENGKILLDKDGNPTKVEGRNFYIYVTDMNIVPKEIKIPICI